jgi:hypothetical protein
VIVPDADWYVKDEVIRQARECKEHLEYDLGIDALIAAPPRAGLPKIKGIDDYLGPDGRGTLEGLEVIDFQLDPIAEAYMLSWPRVRRDAVLNSLKVLRALALRADRQGRVKMSDRAISKRVGISHKAVGRAIRLLSEGDVIEIHGETYVLPKRSQVKETEPRPLGEAIRETGRQITKAAI